MRQSETKSRVSEACETIMCAKKGKRKPGGGVMILQARGGGKMGTGGVFHKQRGCTIRQWPFKPLIIEQEEQSGPVRETVQLHLNEHHQYLPLATMRPREGGKREANNQGPAEGNWRNKGLSKQRVTTG